MASSARCATAAVQLSRCSQPSAGAVVMGADYRALGVVRSLGRQGVPVWVLKQGGQLLGAFSRYAQRTIDCSAINDAERLTLLTGICEKFGLHGWMLFPSDDESVGLAARHYDELAEYYRLTTPGWDVLSRACDKRLLMQAAADAGISYPWTFCPRSRDELATLQCEFPVILKPALREAFNRFTADKAWRVDGKQQLLQLYDEACTLLPRDLVMVQEFIPGTGQAQLSYAAVCQDGQPFAHVCAKRVRQYPMDFGRASTYVETVDDPEVASAAEKLLRVLKITGLVEVEFKRNQQTGALKLLDVNPRVWGWHSLGPAAGVDFPYLLWQMLNGEPASHQKGIAGAKWMRFSTDFPIAVREIMGGRLKVRDYLASFRGTSAGAIFAKDDIVPALLEFPLLLLLFLERLVGRRPI